jgi:ATP-dependent Clp protease protease subunit
VSTNSENDKKAKVPEGLAKKRFLWLGGQITDKTAEEICQRLLAIAVEFIDSEEKDKTPVKIVINSPGGHVQPGLAILDSMEIVKRTGLIVRTIAIGQAASMAAVILAEGSKGCRIITPNARVMIHQPSGGGQGDSEHIRIVATEIVRIREQLNAILAKSTGQSIEKIREDTDRDRYLTPEEAVAYGIVDRVGVELITTPS